MAKGIVGLCIPIIGRVRTILDEVSFKFRVSFDGLLIRKKDFLESRNQIETYFDVVAEAIEVQSSVAFDFCSNENFI